MSPSSSASASTTNTCGSSSPWSSSVAARAAISDASSRPAVRSKRFAGDAHRTDQRRVRPHPVAVLDTVDVDADQTDVHRDAEWIGGQLEDHRASQGQRCAAIAREADRPCSLHVEQDLTATVSCPDGDQCRRDELRHHRWCLLAGEAMDPGSAAVSGRPTRWRERGGVDEQNLDAIGVELDGAHRRGFA